jgi:hypothetical protein
METIQGIAKREKKMLRMVNQSRIKATRNAPRYKFGYCIPRNYDKAMQWPLSQNVGPKIIHGYSSEEVQLQVEGNRSY